MRFNVQNTQGMNIKVYDNLGREIKCVTSYDTETCEITFLPHYIKENGKRDFYSEKYDEVSEQDTMPYRIKYITTIWKGTYATIDGVKFIDVTSGAV